MWIVEIIHYTGYAEFLVWALGLGNQHFLFHIYIRTRDTCDVSPMKLTPDLRPSVRPAHQHARTHNED